MPAFRYEAVNAQGETDKGVISADSARAVRNELRSKGLLPITVEQIAKQGAIGNVLASNIFSDRLSTNESALFTRQLASLLEAGLPIEQSLSALLEQAERDYIRDLIGSIRSEVTSGQSLSYALKMHPRDFNEIYCALVASGEQIGHLASVLSRLADYIERRNSLVQKVRLAFTYPAIVTLVAFAIVMFLLTYVVPQIVSVFESSKQKLPALTVGMLALSDFVRNWGWLVAIILVVSFTLWRVTLRNPEAKMRWHQFLLRAPIYGRFERSLNTARFASTLAITTGSGVPILQALQTSKETLSNVAMKEQVEQATNSVREGMGLARALGSHHYFPPLLVHMIRAGEFTGELPAMLQRAASTQEQDLERRALNMANLLEPVLILLMGVVVLLIVLAVLLPIIEINQMVR